MPCIQLLKGPIPDKVVSASSSNRQLLLPPAPQPPAPALALAVRSDIVSGTTGIAIADDIKAPMASLVIHFRNVGASGIEVRARMCTSCARAPLCASVFVYLRMWGGGMCAYMPACLCLRMCVFYFVSTSLPSSSSSLSLSCSRHFSRSVTHACVSVSSVMHR